MIFHKNQNFNTLLFLEITHSLIVTGPEITGLIYRKYTCLYYGTYLLFCMCYLQSISFIALLVNFHIYYEMLDTIQFTDKKLLHFKFSTSVQTIRVHKMILPGPVTIFW